MGDFAPPVSDLGRPGLGDLAVTPQPSAGQGLALDPKGKLSPSLLAGYPNDGTKALKGDGTWGTVTSKTITGIVTSAAGITAGTGFSVVNNSAGVYTVSFTVPFAAAPVVLVTSISGGGDDVTSNLRSASTSGFVASFTFAGVLTNVGFNFLAYTVS